MSSQSSIDHSPLTARQAEAGGYAWYSAQLYFHLFSDRQDPQAPYPSTHAKGEQMKQLSVTLAKAPPNRALSRLLRSPLVSVARSLGLLRSEVK